MIKEIEANSIGRIIGWTALLATLAVTPWASYDPINVPKLAVIAIGGCITIGILMAQWKEIISRKYRALNLFVVAIAIDLLLVLLISGTNPAQEFFGTFGRSTGFVAYISLAGLLMGGAVSSTRKTVQGFSVVLIISGVLSVIYGLIQKSGNDPINWVNQYSPVIGFLGNPNFQSSFVALSAVLVFAFAISPQSNIKIRSASTLYVLISLYVISATNSQQGFLVFGGGVGVIVLIAVSKSTLKFLTIPSIVTGIVGFIMVTFGTLNKGPLAGLLYKESVTYRGDYWRAGWKMALEHPFFGVGLDSFGDWYRRARTVAATVRRGPDITSNAAHNVLIDFASNGGFPLLLINLFLLCLVLISSIKLVKRLGQFEPVIIGLIAVWIAYQAQSIISLNQLGLAVWGWIISGLIIGYEIHTRDGVDTEKMISKKGKSASDLAMKKVAPNSLIGMFVGLMVGLLIGLPPLIASSKFKSALESGNAQTVEQAAFIWPLDPIRMGQVASILQQNKLEGKGLEIIMHAVHKFPDEYGLWAILRGMPGSSQEQKDEALRQMRRLDPNNTELK